MRHTLDYALPLKYAQPPAYARPAHGRLRELLSWFATGAAVAVGGLLLLALVARVAVRFDNGHGDVRFGHSASDVACLSVALDAFAADTGRYPTDAEGLAALTTRPAGVPRWRGPYVQRLTNDAWGHPYVYHLGGPMGEGYRIASMGRDGREGTADDIDGGSDEPPVRSAPPAARPSGDGC